MKHHIRYLTAGALVRGQIKDLFVEIEKYGGTVTYREHKKLLQTTFTNIEIEARENVIRAALGILRRLGDEND